jgi:segregation and condensation protein B
MTPTQTKNRVIDYAIKYNNSDIARGVNLLLYPDSCQLCTKQYYLPEIRTALGVKKTGTLSTSAIETLAIVAYNQPTTRAFVDALRRVDSSYQMTSLVDRGLIECVGRLDAPGRPMLYGTTSAFLRCFGLAGLDALPETSEELIALFEKTKKEQEEEMMNEIAEQLSIDDLMSEEVHNGDTLSAEAINESTEAPEYEEAGVEDDISYE